MLLQGRIAIDISSPRQAIFPFSPAHIPVPRYDPYAVETPLIRSQATHIYSTLSIPMLSDSDRPRPTPGEDASEPSEQVSTHRSGPEQGS